MKPKEFDELIRQRFDQNDFEYSPGNWSKLEEALDGRPKKRNMIMFWLMPVAGIAASVAMAIGATALLHHAVSVNTGENSGVAGAGKRGEAAHAHVAPAPESPVLAAVPYVHEEIIINRTAKKGVRKPAAKQPAVAAVKEESFGISLQNAIGNTPARKTKSNTILFNSAPSVAKKEKDKEKETKKKPEAEEVVVATFKPEVIQKQPKLSIILSGGLSRSTQANGSGYTAGATIRKMISKKVYIESDVAFTTSNNVQESSHRDLLGYRTTTAAAKTTKESGKPTEKVPIYSALIVDRNAYNQSYAQVTPSIGFKPVSKICVGVGPDFQQALSDNRPDALAAQQTTIQRAPLFDVGLVGKTEYSITRNVKAGVIYRKGVNNVITPMGKYVDRDYMQFQIKCAIFNK